MTNVTIKNKILGQGHPCFLSFEIGSTYSSFDEAKKMVDASAQAGADAVKFQTFTPGDADRMMGKKDLKINFNTPTGQKQELVYEALKRREMPKESWKELVDISHSKDMSFITTPENYPDSINFLKEINVDAIKISKGDINNVILIDQAAKTQLPIILDGREKFTDVEHAVKICEENGNTKIVIMHCPSGYPAINSGVHLNAIKSIQDKFSYPVGFADHSTGSIMNYAAIAMGINMIEKTITLDKTKEEVEHFMSLELNELKSFVENLRAIEDAMGDPNILNTSRVESSARRSIVARKKICKGEKITNDNLDFKRPGDAGISCSEGFEVLGKTALHEIPEGTFLKWDMLE